MIDASFFAGSITSAQYDLSLIMFKATHCRVLYEVIMEKVGRILRDGGRIGCWIGPSGDVGEYHPDGRLAPFSPFQLLFSIVQHLRLGQRAEQPSSQSE